MAWLLIFGTLALRAAPEATQLKVCIVEAMKNSAADPVFCASVVTRLGELVTERSGRQFTARLERVDSATAAERIKSGRCDAVLVVGATRPWALRRLNATTLAVAFGVERNFASVSLIIGGTDARLQRCVADAFLDAVGHGALADTGAQ